MELPRIRNLSTFVSLILILETLMFIPPIHGRRRSITEVSGKKTRIRPGELIFQDNFEDFDTETWTHEITAGGGGNGEFQFYWNNRSNSFVKDGKLHLRPTLTSDTYGEDFITSGSLDLNGNTPASICTSNFNSGCSKRAGDGHIINPIASARLTTINSFAFKYGHVVVRAKLPAGDWLWPAIWMLPKSERYGPWPASGEIDIMESRGNRKLRNAGVDIGINQFGSTLHFGPSYRHNGFQFAHFNKNSDADLDFHDEFHDYEVIWTPAYIKFLQDSKEIGTVTPNEGGFWELGRLPERQANPWVNSKNFKMAPFDQHFFLIVNLAVGGTNTYFPDEATNENAAKPWRNSSPQAMNEFWQASDDWYPTWNESDFIIDYVKVYAL